MDRGTWQATIHRVAKSQTWLSTHMHIVNLQYCVSFRCIAECFGYIYIYTHVLFPSIFQDGWMASLTGWTWVWVSSRSWWWTGKLGMLQSMGSQRVRHSSATELNWWNTLRHLRQVLEKVFRQNSSLGKLYHIVTVQLYWLTKLPTVYSLFLLLSFMSFSFPCFSLFLPFTLAFLNGILDKGHFKSL